ncbi:ran guanine nucleotide release factor isoform X2 [Nothobranchius furzeri]|uniref:ran guanine nucleotide release factor isoform X2 n=1 Tax=Nothobranchius furzeri TaxID=105023 RepID=UPI00240466AA|nr:ran guanine nucleotide release factor isoform X2 [Nothobranchius furzeri]
MQSTVGGGCASLQARPLFGGALSAVIPPLATDISELREIPDNQEVFAHPHTDQSLIVELVEYQAQVTDQNAARYHFEDIAGCNKALEPGAFEVSGLVALPKPELALAECSCAWMLTGTQRVSKFNEESIRPDSSSASAVETHMWTLQDFRSLLQTLTLHDPGLFG